mmetsp:Transcript_41010/g.65980  ORF Transcript_41010/g.65980 Transcript_41010/m.65980 type:complete len:114 (-) Transcript_41010:2106-2447(-)
MVYVVLIEPHRGTDTKTDTSMKPAQEVVWDKLATRAVLLRTVHNTVVERIMCNEGGLLPEKTKCDTSSDCLDIGIYGATVMFQLVAKKSDLAYCKHCKREDNQVVMCTALRGT